MKTVTIKELYAGKPDAKDEINYDGLEGFINTFVIPSSFNIDDLIEGSKFFITGYKGTGKTALLFFLDNYLKQKDMVSCSSFIFFKEEFTDARKSELEIMSRRILNSISIAEDTLLSNTDFEYIWRWLFFKRIVSDNQAYNEQLFSNDENWTKFRNLIDKIKAPSDDRKVIIPPNLKLAVPFKNQMDFTEASVEFDVDFRKSQNDPAYQRFINLIDEAERVFVRLKRTDIPYYIFVDELEAYYGNQETFKRDLYLIRDLIFTIKRFNGLLIRIDPKATKIFCSVRTEIIKAISRFIVTKEMNKVISGFEVPLVWNYNNTTSYAHPIMQILIKRIGTCESDGKYVSKEVYQRWFPEQIHDIEPANYILNNSWFKPRDIVRLLLAAQNSISSNSTVFNQAVFNSCIKRYSTDSLIEIMEEMRALYSSEQIDSIISCFTGFRAIFSVNQLKERVDKLFSTTILGTKFVEVIGDLYRLGFLGNYLPLAKSYRWQHKGDDGVILSDEWRLMIHQALQNSLSVGARQDFGLSRNDPPQIGDVVDITVTKITKSFVFVDFMKNHISYDGVIHISEIDGGKYIRSLKKIVSVGDTFQTVVLGYDTEHDNWQLSRNRLELEQQ